MKLILDYREQELINIINEINTNKDSTFEIIIENLTVGDIVLRDKNDNDLVIIERKRLDDLAASIKDGRYNEQSFRLNESNVHNHNIVYLIEGKWQDFNKSRFNKAINEGTLISSLISINYFKGFSLFRTQTIEESAKYILKFIEKIQKEDGKKPPFYSNKKETKQESDETNKINDATENTEIQQEEKQDNYINSIKKTKKDYITVSNIGEILLSQIPGVSSQIATAVMSKFKTIKNLIKNLEEDSKCLDDIVTTNSGKPRRLNKNSINNIFKYMTQNELELKIT
jgi:ERCC4-type nuclease